MTCARYRALISRYLDGELTPRQKADLLHHIESCPACAQAMARYRQSEVLLNRLPESRPPAFLKSSVLRQARKARRRTGLGRVLGVLGGRRLTVRFGALLALALLVGVSGYAVLPRDTRLAAGESLLFIAPPTATPAYLVVPPDQTEVVVEPVTQPRLIATEPSAGATDVATGTSILLRFDQAMDRRSVERSFSIDPPTTGSFSWEADNELRFTPDNGGLLRGQSYTVRLTDSARGLTGAALASDEALSFSILPAPVLSASYPPPGASNVAVTATMVLTFSQPMNRETVSIRVRGAAVEGGGRPAAPGWSIGGEVRWAEEGKVAFFQPAVPLPAGQVFVEVGAGASDLLGGRLSTYSWPFNVASAERAVSFSGPRLEVLSSGPGTAPVLSFTAIADPDEAAGNSVQFAAYRMPRSTFESLLPWLLDPALNSAGAPWPAVATEALHAVRTWEREGTRRKLYGRAPAVQTALPLREAGIYLIDARITGGAGDQKIVLLADSGLVVMADGGRWTIWTTRFDAADTVGRTRVILYDQDGKVLDEQQVGPGGFYRVDLPSGVTPALAVAERDGIVGLAMIDGSRGYPPASQATDALVITDQPAYQPGDVFSFKALLPGAGGEESEIVQVSLLDPRQRMIGQQRLKADELGGLSGSFALAPGAQPGRYTLELSSSRAFFSHELAVLTPAGAEAPSLSVSTRLDRAAVMAGESIVASVWTQFAPGSPAAVPITLTVSGADGAVLGVYTGTTSIAGLAEYEIAAPKEIEGDVLYFYAEAAGALRGGDMAVLPVDHGEPRVAQELSAYSFAPGETLVLTATLGDRAGQPLAGRELEITLWTRGNGAAPGTRLNQAAAVTDEAGVVTATFGLPLQGAFVVTSRVADGERRAEARDQFWVFGGESAPLTLPPGMQSLLQFTPDRPGYVPGDTARLFVQAGEPGSALLLASYGERVVAQQTITLVPRGSIVSVPIPAAPPLARTLRLTVLRYQAGPAEPRLTRTDFELPIEAGAAGPAQLRVELDRPAHSYSAGQNVQARVALFSPEGEPVEGQVLVRLAPAAPPTGLPPGSAPPGFMNSGADFAPGSSPPAGLEGTRYWNAGLSTAGRGVVTATIALPGEPEYWRLQVWAFTPHGVKMASIDISALAPVAIDWLPVAHMVQGDKAQARVALTNLRDAPLQLEVRLQAQGTLALDDGRSGQQSLTLDAGETASLSWEVSANSAGGGRLVLDVAWPEGQGWEASTTRRMRQVDVAGYGVQVRQDRAGSLQGVEAIGMVLPSSAAPGQAQLVVRSDPDLMSVLSGALAEQMEGAAKASRSVRGVAGRLLAGAVLRGLVSRQLLDSDRLPAGANAQRALDLQFLYGAQHPDGGWGESPSQPPDVESTASVLRALWILRQVPAEPGLAPQQVDDATVQRGLAWLEQAVKPPPLRPGEALPAAGEADLTTRARALYVLALYGVARAEDARALLGLSAALSTEGQSWLALTLSRLGLGREAALLLERITPESLDIARPGRQDTVGAAAAALQAFLSADPEGVRPAAVATADFLLRQRSGAGWHSLAVGEVVAALADYSAAYPDSGAPFSYRVVVNGTLVREVQVGGGGSGGSLLVLVPASLLHTGENSVRLEANGGRIYYSLQARAVLLNETRPIGSNSAREFDGSLLRGYQLPRSGSQVVGELVSVAYTITVGARYDALQLTDPLPGALARIGPYELETLAQGTAGASGKEAPARDTPRVIIPGGRDGAADLMITSLLPGTYRLSYRAIVVHEGTYVALPATLRAAGGSLILARSATSELRVAR